MSVILIYFDGGCRPTNPGNKYGSYEVWIDGENFRTVNEIELGYGTNNEAEFDILLEALRWTVENVVSKKDYLVEMKTDSTILMNRILGRNRSESSEPARRMAGLTRLCLSELTQFRGFTIKWEGRESNVARFGH